MKKFIFLIAGILISFVSLAQTKLDSLVVDEINVYRKSLGLPRVEFDTTYYRKSLAQACKMINLNIVGHSDLSYLKVEGAEVCAFVPINSKESQILTYQKLAKNIVLAWKNSPPHNRAITDAKYRFANAATQILIRPTGVSNYLNYSVYVVSLLTK